MAPSAQVAPVVDGVVETDDEEATGTRLQSREASQRSLFDQAPQDGEPRKVPTADAPLVSQLTPLPPRVVRRLRMRKRVLRWCYSHSVRTSWMGPFS